MREDVELREAPGHGEHDTKQAKQGEHREAERTAAAAAERDYCCQAHFRQKRGLEPNDRFQVRSPHVHPRSVSVRVTCWFVLGGQRTASKMLESSGVIVLGGMIVGDAISSQTIEKFYSYESMRVRGGSSPSREHRTWREYILANWGRSCQRESPPQRIILLR